MSHISTAHVIENGAHTAMPASSHRQTYSDPSFATRLFAPATQWYDEMRWSRDHPKTSNAKRLEVSGRRLSCMHPCYCTIR